jgi:hypothetical protein
MLFNPQITYKKFGKVTDEKTGSRFYETPDGNLSSVTTILGATSDKSGLDAWRKRLGDEKANVESKEATGLGSLMHKHLEKHVMGEERPRGNNMVRQLARNMADVVIGRGLVGVEEVWAIEQELWFPGLYAGTADLVILHKQALAIGDYKTTKKPKKDEWVLDYKLQSVAYSLAHNEVYGTDIRKGIVFMVSRNCEYQEWIVEGLEFDRLVDVWYSRLEEFYSKPQ